MADTVLLAPDMVTIREMLDILDGEINFLDLSINRSTTKVMAIDMAGKLIDISAVLSKDAVKQFVYLEAHINDDGNCCADIRCRFGMAKDAITQLQMLNRVGSTKN